MSDYAEFFLNAKRSVFTIECIELSHPAFSKTYRVTNSIDVGVKVKHQPNGDFIFYEYAPATIQRSGVYADLDQTLSVTVGGLGNLLPEEFERIWSSEYVTEKPTVNHRIYRSDDLNKPIFQRLGLKVSGVAEKQGAATFTAEAPKLNTSKTGEIYSLDDQNFPDLRGAL